MGGLGYLPGEICTPEWDQQVQLVMVLRERPLPASEWPHTGRMARVVLIKPRLQCTCLCKSSLELGHRPRGCGKGQAAAPRLSWGTWVAQH